MTAAANRLGSCLAALAAFVWLATAAAASQELEPRVYSASPVDTNFLVAIFSNSAGTVSLDPSLPLSDLRASVNTTSLSFSHTFPLSGLTATWAVNVPYLAGIASGAVYGKESSTTRDGFPDLRLRFAVNLLGKALSPQEFARRKPRTTLGVGVTIIAPTGTYDATRLINIGSHRWTLKPELGIEVPLAKWFADFAAGVWIFGENPNYYGGTVMQQAPLAVYQVHTGYNFQPGQWLAADVNYYTGGATSIDGARALNRLANSRYGVTFAQPVGAGLSAKISYSHWLRGEYGQSFATVAAGLQYRWFDRR